MSASLAFVACLAWGYSSFRASGGSHGIAALRLTAWSQLAGLALLLPLLVGSSVSSLGQDALVGTLAGVGSGASLALLYDACCRMSAGIASALSAVVAAVVTPIHLALTGGSLSWLATVGLVPCVLGVGMLSLRHPRRGSGTVAAPVLEAAASGLMMAVYYIALSSADDAAFAVTGARVVATVMLGVVAVAATATTSWVRTGPVSISLVMGVGFSGAAGTIAYGYAATSGSDLIAVVAIVSMAPAVTAWLGYWRSGEEFSHMQVWGLVTCVAGAALAGMSTI